MLEIIQSFETAFDCRGVQEAKTKAMEVVKLQEEMKEKDAKIESLQTKMAELEVQQA